MEREHLVEPLCDLQDIMTALKKGKRTVLNRLRNKEIPGAFKDGGEWRIRARDLDAYIEKLREQGMVRDDESA